MILRLCVVEIQNRKSLGCERPLSRECRRISVAARLRFPDSRFQIPDLHKRQRCGIGGAASSPDIYIPGYLMIKSEELRLDLMENSTTGGGESISLSGERAFESYSNTVLYGCM